MRSQDRDSGCSEERESAGYGPAAADRSVRAGAVPSADIQAEDGVAAGRPALWVAIALGAMAGGMGWGIRGQYGHETGAMIAGLLVSLAQVFLFCPAGASLAAARAVALTTVGISLGGSMTYGQTIGLTQDAALVGNAAAFRWGLLGLFLKGGIWIGFAGVFLGMGLSGRTYRRRDWAILLGLLVMLDWAGRWLLNQPFDPGARVLPRLYFSADWRWLGDAELKPRREWWGGLLLALIGVVVYAGGFRKDGLAWRLAVWGFVGGGLGFSLGQCVQAFHAWNLDLFREGWLGRIDPFINWWNFMETTFGAVFGAALAMGLWCHWRRIVLAREPVPVWMAPAVDVVLAGVQAALLVIWEFDHPAAIPAAILPILAIAGGRYSPYLFALPLVALPIVGKTLRHLETNGPLIPVSAWFWMMVPVLLTTAAAVWFARRADQPDGARHFTRRALLGCTWLYFGLNLVVFKFPWPWTEWTARTPNAIVYALCAAGLSGAALRVCAKNRD